MRLPKDLANNPRKPKVYLCQPNKKRIGILNVNDLNGTFKWNAYSEISFTIGRVYNDLITGETKVNPYYDLIQGLRLIELENFGYFQIQDPEVTVNGIEETKEVNAYSLEYELGQRYLDTFLINQGTDGSIDGVVLYNNSDTSKSLMHLVLGEKAPDWSIGNIDANLQTVKRSFEVDRTSVYDFLMNDMSDSYKCIVDFDTYSNEVNVLKVDDDDPNYETDVYVSFDNLANEIKINYSTDDIKTVLTVTGADDISIREVNYGLPHIIDLSFYHTVDWMGQDLYDAYTDYLEAIDESTEDYEDAKEAMQEANTAISTLTYKAPTSLNKDKRGKFEDLVKQLYKDNGPLKTEDYTTKMSAVTTAFAYLDPETTTFKSNIESAEDFAACEPYINDFLDVVWDECGLESLKVFRNSYKGVQTTQTASEWSKKDNENYGTYYTTYIMLQSLEAEITERNSEISTQETNRDNAATTINNIAASLSMSSNFTPQQIQELAPFLREDEYSDDTFVVTDIMTEAERIEVLTNLLNAGKEELQKYCQPQLSFTTTMANLYAMPEFEPLYDQFQLGNMIKIAIRSDYIKKARLLETQINFEDFSDFSVTFGDLMSINSQADIHADLLSRAVSAGKSVAANSSKWQEGADTANDIRLKVNQGLLDAATEIKSIDGSQLASLDNYGIHLKTWQKNSQGEPIVGTIDPEQIWLVNNKIVYTDDNFKTTKSVFGKYTYNGQQYSGLLADAVIGGYVEGATMKGGTINIGNGTFVVDSDGHVVINAFGNTGSTLKDYIDSHTGGYSVAVESSGETMFNKTTDSSTLTCHVNLGNTDVTATLPIGTVFAWKRISTDTAGDATWNSAHSYTKTSASSTAIEGGYCNQITIGPNDVENSAQFMCEVTIA